ncbi:MAG: DAK2 domain-containing protein [Anaerolineaceae bacterium]|nr:DAK2 domain-containing protein [Anaerolineaceae bacterium]
MATQTVDLAQLFGTVVNALAQNQSTLNQADTYNHDHGDNMVEIFEVITQAMKEKSSAAPADQLAYASELLRAKTKSGSAKLYAEGLSDASAKLQGKKAVTTNTAMTLIQALLGAQKKVPTSTLATKPSTDAGTDLLGSLLGGLTGTTATKSTGKSASKIDINTLLKAGMSYVEAKQAGSSDLDAILNAVVSTSRVSDSDYHAQSGAIVANTLLQALTQMTSK